MNTDPRIRYTESVIHMAMLKLLEKKPLDKITVKEICTLAMINRSTFYKHYQDIYDLADHLRTETLQQFMHLTDEMKTKSAQSAITEILEKMKQNSSLFMTIHQRDGRQNFIHALAVNCFMHLEENNDLLKDRNPDEAEKTILRSYITGGSAAIIETWIAGGCTQPASEIAENIIRLSGILIHGF